MTRARYASSAQWVHAVLERARAKGSHVPQYGTPQWCAMDPGDPRFVASIAIAAESWASSTTPEAIAARLAVELDQGRRDDAAARVTDFADVAEYVRGMAASATQADVWERRGQSDQAARARARTARIEADARADPPDPR